MLLLVLHKRAAEESKHERNKVAFGVWCGVCVFYLRMTGRIVGIKAALFSILVAWLCGCHARMHAQQNRKARASVRVFSLKIIVATDRLALVGIEVFTPWQQPAENAIDSGPTKTLPKWDATVYKQIQTINLKVKNCQFGLLSTPNLFPLYLLGFFFSSPFRQR